MKANGVAAQRRATTTGASNMAEWRTREHLEDHFGWHHRELGVRSIEEYDASAQETIALGVRFTYIDFSTRLRRVGYYHRETARFVVTDLEGFIHTHFRTDEGHVADLDFSTYTDE
jgi:hypothetical protein